MVKRQGLARQQLEIDDISNAENEKMPLFVATSSMVMQTPTVTPHSNMQNIEEIIDLVTKKQTDHLDKRQHQVIYETDLGNRKIEEIAKRLDFIERNLKITDQVADENLGQHSRPTSHASLNPVLTCYSSKEVPSHDPEILNGNLSNNHLHSNVASVSEVISNKVSWTEVVRKNMGKPQEKDRSEIVKRKNWKDQLHFLHETAGVNVGGPSYSADVDIVAFNVAKHITSVDLSNCLAENGLNVKECQLLTKSDDARSLSYKITFSPCDVERATKAVSIWPYRVGVSFFKHFNRNYAHNMNKQSTSPNKVHLHNKLNNNYAKRELQRKSDFKDALSQTENNRYVRFNAIPLNTDDLVWLRPQYQN